ncbi:hypothetical protein RJG79_00765 [Mycoplasmatota bacterium WC44]
MGKNYLKIYRGKMEIYILFSLITKVIVRKDSLIVYTGTGFGRESYVIKDRALIEQILTYVNE